MQNNLLQNNALAFFLLAWTLLWKGLSLWRSAKEGQKNWYIVLLILNTLGILEIVYLFKFSKHKLTLKEMKKWFAKN